MKRHALTALLLCVALCLPALAMAGGVTKQKIDVVWLIDVTGSIGTRVSMIRNQMDDFAAQLADCDVRYSLVAFGDEANNTQAGGCAFPEVTVWLTMGSSHWTDSCETLKSYIEQSEGKLPKYSGGDPAETSTNAIYNAAQLIETIGGSETWRDGALRQFVLVTDIQPKESGDYTVQGKPVYVHHMQEAIDYCKDREISVSVASFNDSSSVENAYKDLVEQTNGKYQYVDGSNTTASIGEWIKKTPFFSLSPSAFLDDNELLTLMVVTKEEQPTFDWQVLDSEGNWKHLAYTLTSSFTRGRVKAKDDGTQYRCAYVKNFTWHYSSPVTLSVFAFQTHPAGNTAVDAGALVSLLVKVTGDVAGYQWEKQIDGVWTPIYNGNGVSGTKGSALYLKDVQVEDSGKYRCVATSKRGTTLNSGTATLSVFDITTQPEPSQTVEAGATVSFTVAASGDVAGYQWQKKNGSDYENITGATGATLQLSGVQETDAGTYRCVVSSNHNTTLASNDAVLTVLPALAFTTQPLSAIAEVGANVSFTAQAAGDVVTYQWQRKYPGGDWANVSGAMGTTLSLGAVGTGDNGSLFRCVAKSSLGTERTSNEVSLSVYPALPFKQDLSDVDVDEGTQVSFAVEAEGYNVTYQWQRKNPGGDWTNVSGATGATLDLGKVSTTDSGSMFRCVATSGLNTSKTSKEATLTVAALPAVTWASGNVFMEAGKEAQFSVQATGDDLTFQWFEEVNGVFTPVSGATGATGATLTVTASPEKNGRRYRCVVKNRRGTEVTSTPATLTVTDAPAITLQPKSLRVAVGQDAGFTIGATGYDLRYQWQERTENGFVDCPDAQTDTLTLKARKLTDDGRVYRCVVRSGFDTELVSDEVTLSVVELPDLPETGDSSRLWLWAALCAACAGGLAAMKRRR